MSRETITAAIAELYATIAPGDVSAVAGVTKVYPFEPAPGQMAKPVAVTIDDGGLTDLHYHLIIRVYQSTDIDASQAATGHRAVYQALDVLLTSYWGPVEWVKEHDAEIGALIATCRLEVGREDGLLRLGGGA
jgi:hypothetical protein